VIACEVVWAEVSGQFSSASEATVALERLGITFSSLGVVAAEKSGEASRAYRSGNPDPASAGYPPAP